MACLRGACQHQLSTGSRPLQWRLQRQQATALRRQSRLCSQHHLENPDHHPRSRSYSGRTIVWPGRAHRGRLHPGRHAPARRHLLAARHRGIFTVTGRIWQTARPALPGPLAHQPVTLLRLATTGNQVTALLAADARQHATVVDAWSADGGTRWTFLAATQHRRPGSYGFGRARPDGRCHHGRRPRRRARSRPVAPAARAVGWHRGGPGCCGLPRRGSSFPTRSSEPRSWQGRMSASGWPGTGRWPGCWRMTGGPGIWRPWRLAPTRRSPPGWTPPRSGPASGAAARRRVPCRWDARPTRLRAGRALRRADLSGRAAGRRGQRRGGPAPGH